jgi:DNA topoisomerase I
LRACSHADLWLVSRFSDARTTLRLSQGCSFERGRGRNRPLARAFSAHGPTIEPVDEERMHARAAGLTYVSDTEPGIRRKAAGTGFSYRGLDGKLISDPDALKRIRALAVPPAWAEVWICPKPNGHIQATGRDDRGRKQYRYHADWREVRDRNKYERILEFARALPRIRDRIAEDMGKRGMPREKVLAAVVSLLDRTLIRVGNGEYAKENGSYGLTTLRTRHLEINGTELRFHFKGKSGKTWRLRVRDRRIARMVRSIDSDDVNDYLREIAGPDVSAKDFRTWAGTVLAVLALSAIGPFENRGRDAGYPAPPAQIRTCPIKAYGSHLGW